MKKNLFVISMLVAAVTMFSCAENAIEPQMDAPEVAGTRVGNDPVVMVYVETNDVNPLNALTYVKCGTPTPFIDILNIFAANINSDGSNPSIHFNQELANYMADVATYIEPIQETGMKVLMTLLPNWQGFGPANLSGVWTDTNSQVRKFARLVAYVVQQYGFDGVALDDEYAGYTYTVNNSYGNLIEALRAEFDRVFPGQGKLITVFSWGNTHQIYAAAGAKIDYADHGSFGVWVTNPNIAGVTKDRWMPIGYNFGLNYNLGQVRNNAARVNSDGYGGIMGFNLRNGGGNTLNMLNAYAQGLGVGTVCWTGVNYPEGPVIPGGHTITNADVPSNF